MPARKTLSREAIQDALTSTAGAVAEAAHFLGVSPRTLQRRLRGDPTLRPIASDPRWEDARARGEAITGHAYRELYNFNVTPWSRMKRHVDWREDEIELEPRVLTKEEIGRIARDLFLEGAPVFQVSPRRQGT